MKNLRTVIEFTILTLLIFGCYELYQLRKATVIKESTSSIINKDSLNDLIIKGEYLKKRNDSLIKLVGRYDSTLYVSIKTIEDLASPKVTDETVKEALEWIREYNNTDTLR